MAEIKSLCDPLQGTGTVEAPIAFESAMSAQRARLTARIRPTVSPNQSVGFLRSFHKRSSECRLWGRLEQLLSGLWRMPWNCVFEDSAFMGEQPFLSVDAAAVAGEACIGTDNAMTRDHDRDRVGAICQTDGAG